MVRVKETATHLILSGPQEDLRKLSRCFRFRPKRFFFAVSYQQWKASEGEHGWDGWASPLRLLDNDRTGVILRGHKGDLYYYARENDIPITRKELLPLPLARVELDDIRPDLIKGEHLLDNDQRESILEWVRAGVGTLHMTIGGGKTKTFAGAAAFIKEHYPDARILYITPAERLVRQSTKELKLALPHLKIGQFGGGKKEFKAKDMVVCTVAMVHRNYISLKQCGWFDSFMVVLYDEVHHCASESSQRILMEIPAYFRFGASDSTSEADPTKWNAVRGLFGPILNAVHSAPLIDKGRLAKPHIYVVDVPEWKWRMNGVGYRPMPGSPAYVLIDGSWVKGEYKGPVLERDEDGEIVMRKVKTAEKGEDGEFITLEEPRRVAGLHEIAIDGVVHEIESRWCLLDRTYDRCVVQFKSRNQLIVDWAKYFHSQKWPTVIVATRTTHVYILEALIREHIDPDSVRILIGYQDSSPTERDEMFEWFKSTPGAVLITPLMKEGVSINEIRAMIVADHVSDYEVARQIIGRAMRPKKDGDNRAHVVWFWDRQHSTLGRSSANVLTRLETADGFTYYHPCAGPETVFGGDSAGKPNSRRS